MCEIAELLRHFQSSHAGSVDLLRRLVEIESNSDDKPGVDALGRFVAATLTEWGGSVAIVPEMNRGDHLLCRWRSGVDRKPVLMLGHLDTVWPMGTLGSRPFSIRDGKAYGPGVFDMKAGLLLAMLALKALSENWFDAKRDVVLFLSADEEVGSDRALPHLARAAKSCRAVLCLEPPLPGGSAKTSRSGVGMFHLRVCGIAAHAGVDPGNGSSAILELSRRIVELHGLTDPDRGILVNAGVIRGGTASNVLAAEAEGYIDFRFANMADGVELERRIRNMGASDPRCTLSWDGSINRPPLERSPGVAALYQQARNLAARIGMELGEGSTGGGSDGNFTAAMGIPTLDGLGVEGDGAHALHEHVVLEDIPRRAALLCSLLKDIED